MQRAGARAEHALLRGRGRARECGHNVRAQLREPKERERDDLHCKALLELNGARATPHRGVALGAASAPSPRRAAPRRAAAARPLLQYPYSDVERRDEHRTVAPRDGELLARARRLVRNDGQRVTAARAAAAHRRAAEAEQLEVELSPPQRVQHDREQQRSLRRQPQVLVAKQELTRVEEVLRRHQHIAWPLVAETSVRDRRRQRLQSLVPRRRVRQHRVDQLNELYRERWRLLYHLEDSPRGPRGREIFILVIFIQKKPQARAGPRAGWTAIGHEKYDTYSESMIQGT